MSVFDTNSLLNTEYSEANDTQTIPIPEGEYTGVISKIDIKTVKGQGGDETPVAEVMWEIDSEEVAAVTGRDKNTSRQSIWLELTPGGNIDMGRGKNPALGRLREALKQNVAGKPWSFGQMLGGVATVTIGHRMAEDGTINTNVKRVTALD